MAAKGKATKQRRKPIWRKNKNNGREQGEDRLSSLPDDILITILSCLPLRLAVTTESLSRRWRGLWTNTTSIDVPLDDTGKLSNLSTNKLGKVLNKIMNQLTSPFIDSFCLDVGSYYAFWMPFLDILVRKICDWNIHQLKLKCPHTLPSVIFQTQSLVSIELLSFWDDIWELPYNCGNINLPNLKNLTIGFVSSRLQWIEKLIKVCPSLEQLSLKFSGDTNLGPTQSFKCSNQNLRRLLIKNYFYESNSVVIKAPKLEYLDISALKSAIISFEDEPILLREAKIKYNYKADVQFFTLNISNPKLDNSSSSMVFRNATRLTLGMNVTRDLKTLEMFPALRVLTLNVMDIGKDNEQSLCPQPVNHLSPLHRELRRININIHNRGFDYCEPAKCFLDLVVYLLRNTLNLEHFNLSVQGYQNRLARNMKRKEARELMLCELLYQCPTASEGCDVEFKGGFLNMSRKDGPKAWRTDGGEVVHFRGSPLKYFNSDVI